MTKEKGCRGALRHKAKHSRQRLLDVVFCFLGGGLGGGWGPSPTGRQGFALAVVVCGEHTCPAFEVKPKGSVANMFKHELKVN